MPGINYDDYSTQLELFYWWMDQAKGNFTLCSGFSADEHRGYYRNWQDFLNGRMSEGLCTLEKHLQTLKNDPDSSDAVLHFDRESKTIVDNARALYKQKQECELTSPLSPVALSLINSQMEELDHILQRHPTLMKQHKTRCKAFEDQLEKLRHDLRGLKLPPESLRIFISYPRENQADIDRVCRLAEYLKKAGFDVKPDIIMHNETGLDYLDYIDGPKKTDVILVICTPDVPTSLPGTALFHELGRIAGREVDDDPRARRIFPVILRGDHEKSVPGFLTSRVTKPLNMSNSVEYVKAFFNLINAIYLYDANVIDLTKIARRAYIEQDYESPELEESLPDTSHIAASSSQHGSQMVHAPGSGFFHHPELTSTPSLPSKHQQSPFSR